MYAVGMRRISLSIFLLALAMLAAQNYRLYLADGGNHLVREHKVDGDRVRYYSVERGDWEEIPIEMADLKKTNRELAARDESAKSERDMVAAEVAVERENRRIVASIPEDPGLFRLDAAGRIVAIKLADSVIVTDKKRQALKLLSPIPHLLHTLQIILIL